MRFSFVVRDPNGEIGLVFGSALLETVSIHAVWVVLYSGAIINKKRVKFSFFLKY